MAKLQQDHTNDIAAESPSLDVPVVASTNHQLIAVHIQDVCHTIHMALPGRQKYGGSQGNGLAINDLQETVQDNYLQQDYRIGSSEGTQD